MQTATKLNDNYLIQRLYTEINKSETTMESKDIPDRKNRNQNAVKS